MAPRVTFKARPRAAPDLKSEIAIFFFITRIVYAYRHPLSSYLFIPTYNLINKLLNMKTVAERLAYALAIRGMTQSELARRAGVTRGTISNVMKGVAKNFTAEVSLKVARALDVDVYWLVLGEGTATNDTIQRGIPEEAGDVVRKLSEEGQQMALNILRQLK